MLLVATHDRAGIPLPKDGARPPILACIDEPTTTELESGDACLFSGWAISTSGSDILVRAAYDGQAREFSLGRPRPDVTAVWKREYAHAREACGFRFHLDLRSAPEPAVVTLEFDDGSALMKSPAFTVKRRTLQGPVRANYKEVWNAISESADEAKMAVAACMDEAHLTRSAHVTLDALKSTVGVRSTDVVLEIGAGVGRVGAVLAPICQHWIGTDVSENMVRHIRERLAAHSNVTALAVNGWDLEAVPSGSVDVVYSTVVFMHLDEWERFSYVREAFRVLKPGGRLYVDNVNLLSDEGWALFMGVLDGSHPLDRHPSISKCSTPQELHAYFSRAGFVAIEQRDAGLWIMTFARKPQGAEARR